MLALAGAGLVVVGVVGPVVAIPMGGTPDLFELQRLQQQPGYLWSALGFLAVAGLSLAAAAVRQYRWLWITGLAGVVGWVAGFVRYQVAMEQLREAMQARFAGSPVAWFAQGMLAGVQLRWGAYCMLAGVLLLLGAAIVHERRR